MKPGWQIVSNDGKRLGTVKDVGQNYVQTSAASGSTDLYVPASAIGNVSDGVVQLNVAFNDVRGMGWQQQPRDDDTPEASGESDLHRHV